MDSTSPAKHHTDAPVAKDSNVSGNFAERVMDEAWSDFKLGAKTAGTSLGSAVSEKWSDLETGAKICGEVGKGAVNELRFHPLHVAESAAFGVAAGAAVACLAPEFAIGAAVAGSVVVGYELSQNIPKWSQDAKVVANPKFFSASEYVAADQGLKSLGAGIADNSAAWAAGGAATSLGRMSLKSFVNFAEEEENPAIGLVGNLTGSLTGTREIAKFETDQSLYNAATSMNIIASNGLKDNLQQGKKKR